MQKVVLLRHARKSSKSINSLMQIITFAAAFRRLGMRLFVVQLHPRIPATFAQMASPLLTTSSHIMMEILASKTLTL
jgi:hypothetical protein